MLTADARARASAWALARRARAWTLAYSGMAIAARMPMIATTIINSMRVKTRSLPSILCFPCQNFVMYCASVPIGMLFLPPNRTQCLADRLSWRLEGARDVPSLEQVRPRNSALRYWIQDQQLDKSCRRSGSVAGSTSRWDRCAAAQPAGKHTRGGWVAPPACRIAIADQTLRKADGGAVAGVAGGEGTGRLHRGVHVGAPTSGTSRDRRHEGAADLTERVGHRRGEGRERGGERAHVGGVDADGRREGAGISLSLGQARAGLDVGVQRDGDRGEDADDRDDDHQLDEGEAALAAQQPVLPVPELRHVRCLRSNRDVVLAAEPQGLPRRSAVVADRGARDVPSLEEIRPRNSALRYSIPERQLGKSCRGSGSVAGSTSRWDRGAAAQPAGKHTRGGWVA